MRKRLKKKLGLPWMHKHNVLQNTMRLSRKQQKEASWNVLRYEFLPIGERDYKALCEEYWDEETQTSEFLRHQLVSRYILF